MASRTCGGTIFLALGCLLSLVQLILAGGCATEPQTILPARMANGGKITLSWSPVPGAVSYNVYFSTSPGVTTLNGVKIANAINPITIRDLRPGRTYYFVVTALSAAGHESGVSEEISHTAD
jgi:hypothetical protein